MSQSAIVVGVPTEYTRLRGFRRSTLNYRLREAALPILHLKDEDQYKKVVGTLLKWGCGIEARNGAIIVAPGQYRALQKLGLIEASMEQNGSPARGEKKKA